MRFIKHYRKHCTTLFSGIFCCLSLLSHPAVAQVSEKEAQKLTTELTPVGAIRSANKDKSIPEWTGGLKTPPAFYRKGQHLLNPFPGDKPLYTITRENLTEYEHLLSPGQIRMFQVYPESYRMNVYQTRRTAALPDAIYQSAIKNATRARLVEEGNGVSHWSGAIPFPIPKNGLQAIWNHITRYRGGSIERDIVQGVVHKNGAYNLVRFEEKAATATYLEGEKREGDDNVLIFFKQKVTSPTRMTGNVLLVYETINQYEEPRKAWMYNSGQRRVRRAPQVAYDAPGTASDGLRTADNFDMFSGSPDRYEWELVGRREMLIPYNNFELANNTHRYDDIIKPGHLNRDLVRYELHRVWEVEATLKPGQRHIYGRRTFYIDEDTWQIAVVDHYDNRGQMWRVAEGYQVQYYYATTPLYAAEAIHDLHAKRYLVLGLNNEEKEPVKFGVLAQRTEFTPQAIRRLGIR